MECYTSVNTIDLIHKFQRETWVIGFSQSVVFHKISVKTNVERAIVLNAGVEALTIE